MTVIDFERIKQSFLFIKLSVYKDQGVMSQAKRGEKTNKNIWTNHRFLLLSYQGSRSTFKWIIFTNIRTWWVWVSGKQDKNLTQMPWFMSTINFIYIYIHRYVQMINKHCPPSGHTISSLPFFNKVLFCLCNNEVIICYLKKNKTLLN